MYEGSFHEDIHESMKYQKGQNMGQSLGKGQYVLSVFVQVLAAFGSFSYCHRLSCYCCVGTRVGAGHGGGYAVSSSLPGVVILMRDTLYQLPLSLTFILFRFSFGLGPR